MSSYFDPQKPPPPPAKSATLKQMLAMLVFGTMGSLYVVNAIQSQPGRSLGIGAVLIVCAFVFFAGLISRNQFIELFASAILLLGAGVQVAMVIQTHRILWGVGALFFTLCVVLIHLKHRFIDQNRFPDGELKNPYS